MIRRALQSPLKKQPQVLASGLSKVTAEADCDQARPALPHRRQRELGLPQRKPDRRRLLWIGDAVVPTGFATVTHALLKSLHKKWDVIVAGINYRGESHRHPYPVIPAQGGGDMWGVDCFAQRCRALEPDVVVINNDWWNVAQFLDSAAEVPIVAYMPVDGENLAPQSIARLSALETAIWYTDFGRRQAEAAGYRGRSQVIPHGVDCRLYRPMPREAARRRLGLRIPRDAFVVGNVNRNQPRKRLDLTLQYFAEWIRRFRVRDAYLCLHCARRDIGWDLEQLARYFGIARRVVLTGPVNLRDRSPARQMPLVYNSFDLQITTTVGEGWGLTTMEGMACGVPQVVPEWAALAEWPRHVASVPCPDQYVHPEVNTIGGVPHKETFIQTLHDLYCNPAVRRGLAQRGRRYVGQPCFRWSRIARRFDQVLQQAVGRDAALEPITKPECKAEFSGDGGLHREFC